MREGWLWLFSPFSWARNSFPSWGAITPDAQNTFLGGAKKKNNVTLFFAKVSGKGKLIPVLHFSQTFFVCVLLYFILPGDKCASQNRWLPICPTLAALHLCMIFPFSFLGSTIAEQPVSQIRFFPCTHTPYWHAVAHKYFARPWHTIARTFLFLFSRYRGGKEKEGAKK